MLFRSRITDNEIASYAQRQVEARPPSEREAARRLYASIEYPGAFPAYDKILVDSEEYLWIRRFVKPTDQVAEWRVYDPTGRRRAIVQLPAGLDVFEVGSDYVLGSTSDQFDVQSVHLYALIRRSAG